MHSRAFSLLCLPLTIALGQAPTAKETTLIKAGHVLDVRSGRYLDNQGIVVEENRIVTVGPYAQIQPAVPQGARVIDLSTATILPGLIDCHTHLLMVEKLQDLVQMSTAERALFGASVARDALDAGITTVRDLGNSGAGGDVALRNAIRSGWTNGPRILAATRALSPVGGQFDSIRSGAAKEVVAEEYAGISGVEEARRAVDEAIFAGADVIKVIVDTGLQENYTSVLSEEVLRAIVEEAHHSRAKVAAHAIMNAGVRAAVQAGVDSIEHAYFASDDVLKLMVERGVYLVPTDSGSPTAYYTERLQHARQLGVKVAFGSDARGNLQGDAKNAHTFGERSVATLISYQKSGMSPIDIIRTATLNAADLLGWADPAGSLAPAEQKWVVDADKDWRNRLGSVEPGRFADLIAVTGDPLQNVSELTHVQFVMKNGKTIKNTISRGP